MKKISYSYFIIFLAIASAFYGCSKKPVACFQYTYESNTSSLGPGIFAGDEFKFTICDANIERAVWDFGDGTTYDSKIGGSLVTNKVYTTSGTFTIKLTSYVGKKLATTSQSVVILPSIKSELLSCTLMQSGSSTFNESYSDVSIYNSGGYYYISNSGSDISLSFPNTLSAGSSYSIPNNLIGYTNYSGIGYSSGNCGNTYASVTITSKTALNISGTFYGYVYNSTCGFYSMSGGNFSVNF
jgi:hypothetical protein